MFDSARVARTIFALPSGSRFLLHLACARGFMGIRHGAYFLTKYAADERASIFCHGATDTVCGMLHVRCPKTFFFFVFPYRRHAHFFVVVAVLHATAIAW